MQYETERARKRVLQLVGVLKDKIYSEKLVVEKLLVSQPAERISYQQAQKLDYRTAKLGEQFGPLWTTFWFQGEATLPAEWAGKRVDLIWIAHYCESTLWLDGKPLQALNFSFGDRPEAILTEKAKPKQKIEFQIEMACNTAYGEWPDEKPYASQSPYVLDKCELGVFDPLAWSLYLDFLVLQQLEANLVETKNAGDGVFAAQLLKELNRFADKYDPDDAATWTAAQQILVDLLKQRNASQVCEISAVGEGHMDLAWLWPLAETRRKIIRTTTNQLALMDAYPDYKFVCPQAFVYSELKQLNPQLYEKVKAKIANGQWLAVGGTWVEPDFNLPTGESLVRQLLYGQRYFQKEFGSASTEGWFQDAFGFCAQLPQLLKQSGISRFVSQKFLWGHLKPEHRLFWWQGLDGSQVLAHIPANNAFSNDLTVPAVRQAAADYFTNSSLPQLLMSFGWGDGGGGPNRKMVEIASRLKDVQAVPKVLMRSPSEFYQNVERKLTKQSIAKQVGELYFARHRGTYTSQAKTKRAMRKAEHLLHEVEFLSAIAFRQGSAYPQAEIEALWKEVLLNQFHDILPGTSIREVHEEAEQQLLQVQSKCLQLKTAAVEFLRSGARSSGKVNPAAAVKGKKAADSDLALRRIATTTKVGNDPLTPVNTIGFARHEVVSMPDDSLCLIESPGYGFGKIVKDGSSVSLRDTKGRISLENEYLLAEFNQAGDLLRLFDKSANREALSASGNKLQIFTDKPQDYDAWEIEFSHLHTGKDCPPAHFCKTIAQPLQAAIIFERKLSDKSSMKQTVRLNAASRRLEFHCQVDWHESHKLLKVCFPAAVRADQATYDTQFGAVQRPTHFNTAYDQARFEVPAHKWSDLSESDFGLTLLSDCKYGFSTYGNEMRLSLLRAPKEPDAHCDMGTHEFAYAIMPHKGGWQEAGVVAEAHKFNYPITWTESGEIADDPKSFADCNDANLVIDTIKKAEDSNALVVRLYEAHGAQGLAALKFGFPVSKAHFGSILEKPGEAATVVDGAVQIPYKPFEIITLILN